MLVRQIAEALHLFVVTIDDALDLLRRENFLPLLGAALAEEPLGFVGAFLETGLFFLLTQALERRAIDGIGKLFVAWREQKMPRQVAERLLRLRQHVLVAHNINCRMRLSRPAQDVLAPRTVDFVDLFLRDCCFRVFEIHEIDGEVDRPAKMMRIGNRHVERIADDVDCTCRDREVDRRVTAVDNQRLVGFNKDQPFDCIGNMLLDAPPRRCDFVMVIRLKAENVFRNQPANDLREGSGCRSL
jgi:hypothetical protein